ncbi:unnamed protein product [Cylicocyclus nassatus]|uniref:Uncharacterized protein n=1 Tax=Cylicocyclus nassatus TaxID=53992 RepID=A0AA36GYV8_CYLNA|nr:unnamed protein product [Cylicocyclus nassatus]
MHYVRTLNRINADFLSLLDEQLRMKDQLFTTRVEERSPLFSIRLPDKFLKKHHHPHALLNSNANRLVATRDIGLTLKDIASVNFVFPKPTEINKRLEATSLLSYDLPTYRSCEDTLIPPHLCLCMDEKSLQIEGSRDLLVYKQLFEYVKREMLKYDCVEGVYKAGWEVTVLSLNPMVQQGIKEEKE